MKHSKILFSQVDEVVKLKDSVDWSGFAIELARSFLEGHQISSAKNEWPPFVDTSGFCPGVSIWIESTESIFNIGECCWSGVVGAGDEGDIFSALVDIFVFDPISKTRISSPNNESFLRCFPRKLNENILWDEVIWQKDEYGEWDDIECPVV